MKTLKNNNNERNYGIDALRIIATLMVVTLHILSQGGVLGNVQNLTIKGEFFWGVQAACFCSVNCFALISGYVGLKSKHKSSSLILIWGQLFFYGTLFFCVDCFINKEFTIKGLLGVLFPIITKQNWYISAYWYAFFFMPILNYLINNLSKDYLKKICFIIVILFSVVDFVFENIVLGVQAGYSFIWIAVLYFFGAYIAKYDPLKKWKKRYCILGWIVCTFLTILCRLGLELLSLRFLGEVAYETKPYSYISPLILASAFFLLNFFIKMKINGFLKKVVAFLSPMTLGVFLIHTSPIIYRKLLFNCMEQFVGNNFFVLLGVVIVAVLAVYLICSIIDFIRIWIFKGLRIQILLKCIQSKVECIINKILKIDSKEATEEKIDVNNRSKE